MAVTVEPGFMSCNNSGKRCDGPTFRQSDEPDAGPIWMGFGGIRIEDDVAVTVGDPEVLTLTFPSTDEVEALVGAKPRRNRECIRNDLTFRSGRWIVVSRKNRESGFEIQRVVQATALPTAQRRLHHQSRDGRNVSQFCKIACDFEIPVVP